MNTFTTQFKKWSIVGCAAIALCLSPAHPAHAQSVKLTQELRLGDANDPDIGFSRIGNVAVDSRANVYVVENQDQTIRVFDAKGKPLFRIGHKGKGPGEFTRIDAIGFKGDTLWVRDASLARISMFNRRGKLVTTFPTLGFARLGSPAKGVELLSSAGSLNSDGLVHMDRPGATVMLSMATPTDSLNAPVIRVNREGKIADTVMHIPLYLREDHDKGTAPTAGSRSYRPAQTDMMMDPGTPSDRPIRILLDKDIILIDRHRASSRANATFTITRTTPSGRIVYKRDFRYTPIAYNAAFADSIGKDRGFRLPAMQPAVAVAVAGRDGTLWLRRDANPAPTTTWMIVSSAGNAIGDITLPSATEIRYIGPDFVYVVERDEDDIPYLVRYHISKSTTRG
jgi:hypothetical protein